MPIRKAVIPAAGLGTRFLPATKASRRRCCRSSTRRRSSTSSRRRSRAGLTDILIITGRGKRAIEDHFDRSFELEHFLETKGKFDELKQVREISEHGDDPLHPSAGPARPRARGRGGREHVGGEPFAVLLGDDLIHHSMPLLPEMLAVHERYGRSVIAAQEVPREEISLYGCIEPEPVERQPGPGQVDRREAVARGRAVEPRRRSAATCSRPRSSTRCGRRSPARGGEIQLTDAINLLAQEQAFYAYRFDHGRFDVGNKLDYLKATVEFALERDDIGQDFRAVPRRDRACARSSSEGIGLARGDRSDAPVDCRHGPEPPRPRSRRRQRAALRGGGAERTSSRRSTRSRPLQLPLTEAYGCVAAEDVVAERRSAGVRVHPRWTGSPSAPPTWPVPPRASPIELKIVGSARIGRRPDAVVGGGEAVRIATGAPIPAGADTVVPIENAEPGGEMAHDLRRPAVRSSTSVHQART